jgi:hypothetical protein
MAGSVETLNGIAPSWAECEIVMNVDGGGSVPDIDWKNLDYEDKIDRAIQRGPGGRPKSKTTGQSTSTGSGTLYRSGYDALIAALIAVAPVDSANRVQLSKARFDLVVTHSYEADAKIYTVKLLGCSLDKRGAKHGEGIEADTIDVDLSPMKIVEMINGREVVLL